MKVTNHSSSICTRTRKSVFSGLGAPGTRVLEKESENMCDYSKMIESKGIAKGVVEGLLSALKKMIANANMTPEQAMNILDIPENERAMYKAKLSK